MTRTQLINLLILNHGYSTYLEIGCQNNVNFDKVKNQSNCLVKTSVDPDPKANADFALTSDGFFESLKISGILPFNKEMTEEEKEDLRKKIIDKYIGLKGSLITADVVPETISIKGFDIVFIDGLHHADQVERDIINSMACLNPGGIIVLHDCNPPTEKDQMVPRRHKVWYGDVWRAFVGFRLKYPDVMSYCVEDDCGCGVIHYTCQNIEPGFITDMSWEHFANNRHEYLGLL